MCASWAWQVLLPPPLSFALICVKVGSFSHILLLVMIFITKSEQLLIWLEIIPDSLSERVTV